MKISGFQLFQSAALLALCVAGTGLEANGPIVKSPPDPGPFSKPGSLAARKLKPPVAAPSARPVRAPSSARAMAPLQQDRPGKLESYIRNSESVRKAERLRSARG